MYLIEEYILLPQKERQYHLDLVSPCIMRGGQSMYLKGLLAHILDTTIPAGKKIHVCHACHNELCPNPNHIYWGTASENAIDAVNNGRKSVWENMVSKYGIDDAKAMQKRSKQQCSNSGKKGGSQAKSDVHKKNISDAISNQVCYTNGLINIKQHKDLPPPEGFYKGMVRHKK